MAAVAGAKETVNVQLAFEARDGAQLFDCENAALVAPVIAMLEKVTVEAPVLVIVKVEGVLDPTA